MRLFRRKSPAGGRHALGAAVTGIPSLVPPVAPVPAVVPAAAPSAAPTLEVPVPVVPVPAVLVPAVPVPALPARPRIRSRSAVVPAAPAPPLASRVQLGFRDGSCLEIDPSSAHSRALCELADLLTGHR